MWLEMILDGSDLAKMQEEENNDGVTGTAVLADFLNGEKATQCQIMTYRDEDECGSFYCEFIYYVKAEGE